MYKKMCLNKLFFLKLRVKRLNYQLEFRELQKIKLEQDDDKSGSGVAQNKSISGLRLWGLRCTERAAATSGSTSSHSDFSWTKEQEREKGARCDRHVSAEGQMDTETFAVTCVSWREEREVAGVCEITLRRKCLAGPRIWKDSTWRRISHIVSEKIKKKVRV